MKHQDLLQKHAKALGVPEVKISYMFRMGADQDKAGDVEGPVPAGDPWV